MKVAGRRPVSSGVELNRFAWSESSGVGCVYGLTGRCVFVTGLQVVVACQVISDFQVVRACQVVSKLLVIRARRIIRAGQVALVRQVIRNPLPWIHDIRGGTLT